MTAEELRILEERAARVRRRAVVLKEETLCWVAEFPVADERYAILLESLRAAVPLRMVRSVPLSPPNVIGIVRHEGQLLTAFSLASLLGVRGWRQDPAILLVVESGRDGLCALDCEVIPTPTAVPQAELDEARARSGGGAVFEATLPGLRQLRVIDLSKLLGGLPGGRS